MRLGSLVIVYKEGKVNGVDYIIDATSVDFISKVRDRCKEKNIEYPPRWCKINTSKEGKVTFEVYSDSEVRRRVDGQK